MQLAQVDLEEPEMQTTLQWIRQERDDRNPIVEIRDLEHCGKCRKHLTFRLGGEVVEIQTDENGLKAIAEAITQHPETMRQKAQEKIKEAIEEARRLGIQIDDVTTATEPAAG